MKQIVFILFICLMSCREHTLSVNNSQTTSLIHLDSIESDADHQWTANNNLDILLRHYGEKVPDYYAGSYIDREGKLVINIQGDFATGKAKVICIIGKENILFKKEKYSYKDLEDIMEYLNALALKPENKILLKNISAWSLHDKGNHVEVCFIKMTDESIKNFKKYILNSNAIKFKECGSIIEE